MLLNQSGPCTDIGDNTLCHEFPVEYQQRSFERVAPDISILIVALNDASNGQWIFGTTKRNHDKRQNPWCYTVYGIGEHKLEP